MPRPPAGDELQRTIRLQALLITLSLTLLLAAACSGSNGERKVTGYVADVQPAAIDTFRTLTLRDYSGNMWTFGEGRFPAFTPSHLVEHQAVGEPITVTYVEEENGTLRVLEIVDAPYQTSPSAR